MPDEQQETQRVAQQLVSVNRRSFLGVAALGAAVAGAAGFAGGRASNTPPAPQVSPAPGAPRFANKVVLITGATSGIGRAAAIAFAAEGAKVGFCGRREDRGQAVEQQIRAAGNEATYIRADVRVERDVQSFVDTVVERYGRLDSVFSNAGIHAITPLHEISTEVWDDVINTNLRGAYFTMKYSIPHLLAVGGGNILITSSINAIAVRQGFAAYGASKHALIGLMQSAALDYGTQGIRVNAILPGFTDTEMVRRLSGTENLPDAIYNAGVAATARSRAPAVQRAATAEEIAAFALDLASDRYPFMTGSAQVIDGGATASLP